MGPPEIRAVYRSKKDEDLDELFESPDSPKHPRSQKIGYSAAIGVVIAFLGYAKSSNPEEQFSLDKLMITPITGLSAGIVMAFWQVDYSSA